MSQMSPIMTYETWMPKGQRYDGGALIPSIFINPVC